MDELDRRFIAVLASSTAVAVCTTVASMALSITAQVHQQRVQAAKQCLEMESMDRKMKYQRSMFERSLATSVV